MPTSAFRSHSLPPLSWWSTTCGDSRRSVRRRATATLRFSSSNKESGCGGNRSNAAACRPARPRSTVRQRGVALTSSCVQNTLCSSKSAVVFAFLKDHESCLMKDFSLVLVLSCSFPFHWQRRLQKEFSRLVSGPVRRLGRGGGGVRAAR